MPGGRGSLGPRGFLTEEEKQNMPKVTKELLITAFCALAVSRIIGWFMVDGAVQRQGFALTGEKKDNGEYVSVTMGRSI